MRVLCRKARGEKARSLWLPALAIARWTNKPSLREERWTRRKRHVPRLASGRIPDGRLVAVAGPVGSPTVIGRRRVELADPEVPRPVQPYHAAQKLDLKKAKRYIERFADRAKLLANRALREVIDGLREAGYEAVGCGVPIGGRRQAATLEAALASHPMLHTAEGELFRNALISAGEECGLGVLSIRERELFERGVRELGLSNDALRLRLDELGRPLGPPWGQDQKMAALAAWLTLAASESKPVGCES